MPLLIARVEVPHVSGLPEETITNTFYVAGTPTPASMAADLNAALPDSVYQWTAGFGSSEMEWENSRLLGYDAADATPRVPVYNEALVLNAATEANPLPPEVALCLSYRSAQISGENLARCRGRLYMGPFNEAANTTADSTRSRPASTLVGNLVNGAVALAAALDPLLWVLYSSADGVPKTIVSGWVDNAWDTQRRRGNVPNTRTPYTIA
jgi:hypothetical protein